MSKKVIFVGPSGAGKTTLRKIFFEGENSSKLLEYALEPTFGEESLILRLPKLSEDVGIFDLAGQENERWLETEERSIFNNTKVILVIIDVTTSLDFILDFIKKVLEVRSLTTPNSFIYVLLHKIDLVSQKKIRDIKAGIKGAYSKAKLIKFLFTSLKKEYITQTFSYFIEIMKKCLDDVIPEDGLMFNVIDESIKIVNIIDTEVSISKKEIQEKLNRPEKLIDYLLESLVNKDHVEITYVKNQEILSLTEKGKDYFKKILKPLSTGYLKESETRAIISEPPHEEKVPSFIGAFIADKDGRTLLSIELFENALEKFIGSIPSNEDTIPIDLDLIPMFISALEKFSLELNIKDLAGFNLEGSNLKMNIFSYEDYGFNLEGSNLKMNIFSYEDYTVTFFMNPDININPVQNKIHNYFKNIFEEYEKDFENALNSGQIDGLFPIIDRGRKWLEDLNKSYEEMIINLEIFDTEHAKILYSKMDELYKRVNVKFSMTLEKIKKLKVNLMKAIIENDIEELKKIAESTKDLSAKYTI
jgi:GTPase SAR1 family protein